MREGASGKGTRGGKSRTKEGGRRDRGTTLEAVKRGGRKVSKVGSSQRTFFILKASEGRNIVRKYILGLKEIYGYNFRMVRGFRF